MVKRPIIFVHVPKTAGSTIHAVMSDNYEQCFTINGVTPEDSLAQFENLSETEKRNLEVIKGHLTLRTLKHFQNPFVFTYLRDPLDQFLSAFYYIKRATWNPHYNEVAKLSTLEEYLSYAAENGLDNIQTRHLSNSIHAYPSDAFVQLGEKSASLLKAAKANLDSMDWVFQTHQFDASLLILKLELGWKQAPYYSVQNRTKNRKKIDEVSTEVKQKILALNALDAELFAHAASLNKKQMLKYDLKNELKKFERDNKRYQLRAKAERYINKFF